MTAIFKGKWKTTSIFRQMEDDLNFVCKWNTTSNFCRQMEDDVTFKTNGTQTQFSGK